MIARLQEKVDRAGLADRVDARVLDFAALRDWDDEGFEGIISAFAGLNSAPDLRPFAADAARLLTPGGHLVVHLLNRFSLWEWLGLVRRGEWEKARTLDRQSERRFVVGGVPIRQYPLAPDEAYARFFAPWFRRNQAYGLGIFRPPHTVRRIPGPAIASLECLEALTRETRWLRGHGRLFVLDLVRREVVE
jgi:SAM-dependent methyltransferase